MGGATFSGELSLGEQQDKVAANNRGSGLDTSRAAFTHRDRGQADCGLRGREPDGRGAGTGVCSLQRAFIFSGKWAARSSAQSVDGGGAVESLREEEKV